MIRYNYYYRFMGKFRNEYHLQGPMHCHCLGPSASAGLSYHLLSDTATLQLYQDSTD